MQHLGWLRSWPLLIASAIAIIAGTRLLESVTGREVAAAALLTMGAILLGAWIAMLSGHDYPGEGREEVMIMSEQTPEKPAQPIEPAEPVEGHVVVSEEETGDEQAPAVETDEPQTRER